MNRPPKKLNPDRRRGASHHDAYIGLLPQSPPTSTARAATAHPPPSSATPVPAVEMPMRSGSGPPQDPSASTPGQDVLRSTRRPSPHARALFCSSPTTSLSTPDFRNPPCCPRLLDPSPTPPSPAPTPRLLCVTLSTSPSSSRSNTASPSSPASPTSPSAQTSIATSSHARIPPFDSLKFGSKRRSHLPPLPVALIRALVAGLPDLLQRPSPAACCHPVVRAVDPTSPRHRSSFCRVSFPHVRDFLRLLHSQPPGRRDPLSSWP